MLWSLLFALLGAALFGVLLGYVLRYFHALSKNASVELSTKQRLLAAEQKAIDIVERAKIQASTDTKEAEKRISAQEKQLHATQERLVRKEELLDRRQIDLDSEVESVRVKIDEIKALRDGLALREADIDTRLQAVAVLTKEEARATLMRTIEAEYDADITARIQKLEQNGEEQYEKRAQEILTDAIHRLGNTTRADLMTAQVELPGEETKGKIIGKEGRNVRAFEHATGVDVLIDETPGFVTLSSFDPLRREIARVALEALISDGRIQPAKIEEAVEKARAQVGATVRKMGEKAAQEAGVPHIHPDLIQIMGRLHFRTSYGQNVLWHSVEMAHIAAIIAGEVGADVGVARAGAFLHDIGKAVSHEVEGTHVEIGRRMLQKYGVEEPVIQAMQAHHEEYPYETPESKIVQVADALSGGRPGARRDSFEHYIKRLGELEAIAKEEPGVEKVYAIAAGREVRVFVNPQNITDSQAHLLARHVARRIEKNVRYPGEIKVSVIREMRVIEYAR